MTRTLFLACLTIAFVVAGCGKKEQAASDREESSHGPSDDGTFKPETPPEQASQNSELPTQSPETRQLQNTVTDISSLMAQAHAQESKFDYDGAIATWRQVQSVVEEQFGTQSWQSTNARLAVITAELRSHMNLEQRRQLYELNEAEQLGDELAAGNDPLALLTQRARACDLARELWGDDSHILAGHLYKQAQAHLSIGQFPEAETLMKSTLAIREKVMGKVHPEYINVQHALAILYQQQGALDLAMQGMTESLANCRRVWGDDSRAVATYLNDLGVLYYTVQEWEKAENTLMEALDTYQACDAGESFDFAHCQFNLGNVYVSINQVDLAESGFRGALEKFMDTKNADHEMIQQTRTQLATVLLMQNELAEAEKHLADVVESRRRAQGEDHPAFATSLFQLGIAYGKQGKYDLAEPALRQAYASQRQHLPADHRDVINTADALVQVLRKRGNTSEADALEQQIRIASQSGGNPVR